MGNDSAPIILVTAALDDRQLARIREAAPGSRIVREVDLASDPGLLGRVEIAYPRIPREMWAGASSLRWVQANLAGVDALLSAPGAREHPSVMTNVHTHVHSVSEHMWGLALMLVRNLHGSVRVQQSGHWNTAAVSGGMGTLAGGTLCVVGLGAIGAQCAAIGKVMGMKVIGISRSPRPHPSVDEMVTPDRRRDAFSVSTLVMLILPGTEETRGFVGKRELDALRGAWLVNGGRGSSVDTAEMVRALQDGRLRGAGLDVTDPEPLPDGHPLWALPNVIISPHYAGIHPGFEDRALEVFCANLRRWVRGEPLQDVVDKSAGY